MRAGATHHRAGCPRRIDPRQHTAQGSLEAPQLPDFVKSLLGHLEPPFGFRLAVSRMSIGVEFRPVSPASTILLSRGGGAKRCSRNSSNIMLAME